ncbi:MAG TPA: CopG family transcriptional regulator [Dehalococcoidia bacterium]|nr:CopG family transcriptional regulator [Dehalococcoidia bacterium]
MRTTLDIEDDVLMAAKEIARHKRRSVGKVVSDLARQALTQRVPLTTRHGIPQLPVRPDAGIVTLELVNQLRDESP